MSAIAVTDRVSLLTRYVTRPVLWIIFLGVHVVIAVLGWTLAGEAMGDVYRVYEPWSHAALSGGPIVGVTQQWVYPQVALLPMVAAKLIALPLEPFFTTLHASADAYTIAWALLVTACNAAVFSVLLSRRRRTALMTEHVQKNAALFWSATLLLLGPIAMYRIDAIAVPVTLLAVLLLADHPAIAGALIAAGAWIKIWPGVIAIAAVTALRHRRAVLTGAVIFSAVTVATVLISGGWRYLLGFISDQGGRGLQVESVAAIPYLWLAVTGHAQIAFNSDLTTFEITGPGTTIVATLLTPLLVVAVGALAVWGAWRLRSGVDPVALFAALSLALVVVLIVCNKVGSPQFQTWLIVPVMIGIMTRLRHAALHALLVLTAATLTFIVYPVAYGSVLRAVPWAVAALSIRNILLLVLLACSVRAISRVRKVNPDALAPATPSNHNQPS